MNEQRNLIFGYTLCWVADSVYISKFWIWNSNEQGVSMNNFGLKNYRRQVSVSYHEPSDIIYSINDYDIFRFRRVFAVCVCVCRFWSIQIDEWKSYQYTNRFFNRKNINNIYIIARDFAALTGFTGKQQKFILRSFIESKKKNVSELIVVNRYKVYVRAASGCVVVYRLLFVHKPLICVCAAANKVSASSLLLYQFHAKYECTYLTNRIQYAPRLRRSFWIQNSKHCHLSLFHIFT